MIDKKSIDKYMQTFETAFPATVKAVNDDGTISAIPSVRNCLINGVPEFVGVDVKPIENIPVLHIGINAVDLSMELQEGDPVLLISSSRDLSQWKQAEKWDTKSYYPKSFGGNDLNNLLAIPVRTEKSETPKVKIEISKDGKMTINCDGELDITSAKTTIKNDVEITGALKATGEITAMSDSTNVSLSTHIHATAVGNSSPPTPNT